jgi:hypothetical protein
MPPTAPRSRALRQQGALGIMSSLVLARALRATRTKNITAIKITIARIG